MAKKKTIKPRTAEEPLVTYGANRLQFFNSFEEMEQADAKAIEKDDTAKGRKLLKNQPGSILNYQEKTYGQSLLNWAVYAYHYPSVKLLAELGADSNLKGYDSIPAIINAARMDTTIYLEVLINHGGNVNIVADIVGPQRLRTPLMVAANTNLDNVKLLINAGADAKFVYKINNNDPQSALLYALRSNNMDIINYLILDVGVDYKSGFGVTLDGDSIYIANLLRLLPHPLDSEAYQKKMKLVNFFKENGIDYRKSHIPKHYYKNYDSVYLSKY